MWRGRRGERRDRRKGETGKKRKCGVVLKGIGVAPLPPENVLLWISVSKLCRVGLYVGYVTQRGQVALSVTCCGGLNTA